MPELTVCVASPTTSTPMYVAGSEALRTLVTKAESDGVEIDWSAGVTLSTIEPESVTTAGGQEVAVSGVVLVQAVAQVKPAG